MRLISKLLCSALLVSASLSASAYSSLVVFGDSLSDNGNNTLLLGSDAAQVITGNSYVPSLTYASGVYSNGPVWATQFADKLGLGLSPSLLGGTNYAFGGAQTSLYVPGASTPSLIMQTGMYLTPRSNIADSTGLYVVAGGGNNIRDTLTAVGTAFALGNFASIPGIIFNAASQFAADIGTIVDSLQGAGAQDIIVWNAPDLGATPAVNATGFGPTGTQISQTFNQMLALRLSSEIGVKTFDLYGLSGQAAAEGFTNTADACGAVNVSCNVDMSKNLFWDGIHPTTAAHSLIAQNMFVTAVPEPETYAMMIAGLGLVGAIARRRKQKTIAA